MVVISLGFFSATPLASRESLLATDCKAAEPAGQTLPVYMFRAWGESRSARNPFRAVLRGGILSAFGDNEDRNPPRRGPQNGFWGQQIAAESAGQTLPSTTSAPASQISLPTLEKVDLPVPGRDGPSFYWLRKPAGYTHGQMPPLVIALHGTDDTAQQMVDFWAARSLRIPPLIAAPQGVGPGWRDSDTAIVQAMFTHLQANITYDPERVLLAGFSAGGAMSLQLLYVERVPVTAVAALANYVPPWITEKQVRERQQVPVFYAVGMGDINHERMRKGIQRLRAAGARIDLDRPRIGHVLNTDVAQAAVDWFFDRCAERVSASLDRATADKAIGDLPLLDWICQQRSWHEAAHAQRAERLIEEIEGPGRQELVKARALVAESRPADAVEVLAQVESKFTAGPLVRQARVLRLQLESDPAVRREISERQTRRRAEQALSMYTAAQQLVVQRRFDEAAEQCRKVLDLYADTPSAERARTLLTLLEKRNKQ